MIQILLLILKIIGIIILAVLGLIFLVLALVLFVPIFYQVRIIHNPQQTKITAKVSFLWPAIIAVVQYLKKLSFKVKLFGIAILDSEKPKKEKTKKDKKPKRKKQKSQKDKKKNSETAEVKKEDNDITASLNDSDSLGKESKDEASFAEIVQQKEENGEEQTSDEEKQQGVFDKIRVKIQKIRETISNIVSKIKKLLHQKDEVLRILGKTETKEAISFVFGKLGRILKHILPRKIKGYVAYGAGDPATTGQVLGILGVVYARTGQVLEIRPNFLEKQLECDVLIKGRGQVFTLLLMAIKVVLNKGVRQVIKEVKGIKDIE